MRTFGEIPENRLAFYLLKGSAMSFTFMLGRTLYCNNSETDGVSAFNEAKEFYRKYLRSAQVALKDDLLRNDYSAYNIKDKLQK